MSHEKQTLFSAVLGCVFWKCKSWNFLYLRMQWLTLMSYSGSDATSSWRLIKFLYLTRCLRCLNSSGWRKSCITFITSTLYLWSSTSSAPECKLSLSIITFKAGLLNLHCTWRLNCEHGQDWRSRVAEGWTVTMAKVSESGSFEWLKAEHWGTPGHSHSRW